MIPTEIRSLAGARPSFPSAVEAMIVGKAAAVDFRNDRRGKLVVRADMAAVLRGNETQYDQSIADWAEGNIHAVFDACGFSIASALIMFPLRCRIG